MAAKRIGTVGHSGLNRGRSRTAARFSCIPLSHRSDRGAAHGPTKETEESLTCPRSIELNG